MLTASEPATWPAWPALEPLAKLAPPWGAGLVGGLVGGLPVPPWPEGERAERSGARAPLGTTKEVLVIIDLLVFNYDFLGFPSIVLGFINIS